MLQRVRDVGLAAERVCYVGLVEGGGGGDAGSRVRRVASTRGSEGGLRCLSNRE